jgi:hypothetical protein
MLNQLCFNAAGGDVAVTIRKFTVAKFVVATDPETILD